MFGRVVQRLNTRINYGGQMDQDTISAQPEKLIAYGNRAVNIDEMLISEGRSVLARLSAFEAKCTEPGFSMPVAHLATQLADYGQRCLPGDEKVRQTGLGFLRADSMAVGAAPAQYAAVAGATAQMFLPASIQPALFLASLLSAPSWLRTQIARLPWLSARETAHSQVASVSPTHATSAGNATASASLAPQPLEVKYIRRAIRGEEVPLSVEDFGMMNPMTRGDGKTDSNCTWFAATALYTATGINLHALEDPASAGKSEKKQRYPLGDAHEWRGKARNALNDPSHALAPFVDAVNKTPKVGAVMVYQPTSPSPRGHVAWVEAVERLPAEGKLAERWKITVIEEHYGGENKWAHVIEDLSQGNVKRWRRTFEKNVDQKDPDAIDLDGVDFIHWKADADN